MDIFIKSVLNLAKQIDKDHCQIIIANESTPNVYEYMNQNFIEQQNIFHFTPNENLRTGANDKLNGVFAAMNIAIYENILLIDDHYRIDKKNLYELIEYYKHYDCFKMMPIFEKINLTALIDLCGMLVINILDHKKQYCGHLAFKKSVLERVGFPNRNVLFDEFAIENKIRHGGFRVGFIKDVALKASQNITIKKFLEQRIRYAYENIAFPVRFTSHLSVLPILICSLYLKVEWFYISVTILTLFILIVALIGQIKYGKKTCSRFIFILSPIWFWFYPFTSWIAVYKYFTGGVLFGGRRVKEAA